LMLYSVNNEKWRLVGRILFSRLITTESTEDTERDT
jgi:hypothetical protein